MKYTVAVDAQLEYYGVLLEPTSVVAKAWEQADRVGVRAWFEPQSVLVTGAGPVGLLAALIGVQRGLDVPVHYGFAHRSGCWEQFPSTGYPSAAWNLADDSWLGSGSAPMRRHAPWRSNGILLKTARSCALGSRFLQVDDAAQPFGNLDPSNKTSTGRTVLGR